MEEREEIKLKILLLVILSIPIIASILFILGVNKVYAASSIYTYLPNGTVVSRCENTNTCNNMTLNQQNGGAYEFLTPATFAPNSIVTIRIDYQTQYIYKGIIINETSPFIYLRGSIVTDITNQCTINGTQSNEDWEDRYRKTFRYSIICNLSILGTDAWEIGIAKTINITEDTGSNSFRMGLNISTFDINSQADSSSTNDTIENSTTNIINNNNNNTQNIIDNNNQNTQDIIDNQNANSQAQIDKIDESFNSCENYNYNEKNIKTNYDGYRLNETGDIVEGNNWKISDYIPLNENETYTLTKNNNWGSNNGYYCLYDKNKNLKNCTKYSSTLSFTITGSNYIRIDLVEGTGYLITLTGKYCYNRLDGKPYEGREVDKEKAEEYLSDEQDLLDLYNTDQLDIVDISVDTNGNQWVWDRIVQFMNTNEYIRLMIISILSLGVIKLVLAR